MPQYLPKGLLHLFWTLTDPTKPDTYFDPVE